MRRLRLLGPAGTSPLVDREAAGSAARCPEARRPIFIFGCPRSGTSLLSRILSAHPRIAIPFESHVYHYLYAWRGLYGDLRDPSRRARLAADILETEDVRQWRPPPSLERTLAAATRPDFHGVFAGLMDAWARDRGKERWGEKTPQHTLYWREIHEGFPDLQAIHLVRDGRDVAVSYKRAFFGPKHVYPIARRWLRFLHVAEEARALLGEECFLTVRYEDLLEDPSREVMRICRFLGESFSPAMLDSHRDAGHYPTDPRNERNLREPILAANREQWRSRMSPRELRIFEATAGRALERYGYVRALPPRGLRAFEPAWYTYVEHPPVKALALLGNRKSQRITLQRLRIYLRLRAGR